MLVSTKGRYALKIMTDLAIRDSDKYTPLKEMAEKHNISQKYMEAIMTTLSKAKLVKSHHGKGGGYKLNRKPSEYPISEILATTEISIAPVSCLKDDEDPCPSEATCSIFQMWKELYSVTKGYLDNVTLEDLKQKEIELNGE